MIWALSKEGYGDVWIEAGSMGYFVGPGWDGWLVSWGKRSTMYGVEIGAVSALMKMAGGNEDYETGR